jgi:murein DD-endopeptidase MepM/ murein hydrolase activator NlpD
VIVGAPFRARSVILVALLVTNSATAFDDCELQLPDSAQQGQLVVGRLHPGCRIGFGERTLRVAPDGTFVFGIARDAAELAVLVVRERNGNAHEVGLAVVRRAYPTERVDGVPPSTVTPPPEIAERIAREQARVAKARERDDARTDFLQAFAWPAQGRVSGVYGSQRILNGVPKDPHYGLDIAAKTGTPVRAPAAGVVTFADADLYLTGGTVVLDHGHGVSSVFIHLSRVDAKVGDVLAQGGAIGAVGMTGRATGPHLHWGMNWFETRIDPRLLMSR